MISDLINLKSNGEELPLQSYYEAVDYLLNNGADMESVKFFLSLNSFGMTKREVLYLAMALRDSGRILKYNQNIFEKHSTGGIGDPSSLVLIPLLASLGYKVIKTTGKSLMYTNGSSDRFGAIPNFNVKLTSEEIENVLNSTNACILSHNGDICPADKILYTIIENCGLERDINLLAASIACKKLACGASVVLVDVKYGDASVVKNYHDALKLAGLLKYIFDANKVKSVMVLTNTMQTLGQGIGNAIEVDDALDVLKGKKCLLRDICSQYALEMIKQINPQLSRSDIMDMINVSLDNMGAYKTFKHIVKLQGGDEQALNKSLFKPYKIANFTANKSGYVGYINSLVLGEITRRLCAVTHDNNIGVRINVKIGDYVNKGDIVLSFYFKDDADLIKYRDVLCGCVRMSDVKIKKVDVVKKVIR